jgi:hypothetical protein
MTAIAQDLFAFLDALAISYEIFSHPSIFTAAEGAASGQNKRRHPQLF